MKIVVGLGNPGIKYAGSRHNTGFSVITSISDKFDIPLNKKQCKAVVGLGLISGERVVLAEPQTFMNLSGEAVSALLHFYRCDVKNLIVIYDDMDLEVGKIRLRGRGSAGGHNGIKNIIEYIGTDEFERIKVGIGKPPAPMEVIDYVLGRFPSEELPIMRESVDKATLALEEIIKNGIDSAMNKYN